MATKTYSDGLKTLCVTTIPKPGTYRSAAEVRAAKAAFHAAFGAWGFAASVGKAEAFWRKQPAAPDPEPLTLAWYRDQILTAIAYLRSVVALKASAKPVTTANLEYWILTAMELGRLTEEAGWRFNLGDDARLGRKTRAKKRSASGKATTARRGKADAQRRIVLAKAADYRREHPDHRDRTIAAILARTTGVAYGTVRGYLGPKKTA